MHTRKSIAVLVHAVFLTGGAALAQPVGSCAPSVAEAILSVANVDAPLFANGNLFWHRDAKGATRYVVPRAEGVSSILTSAFWIGGFVNDSLSVAAARYGPYHYWTGPIDDDGHPPVNCSQYDRIWKVSRRDVAVYDAEGVATPDLRDWPTGLGAPTLSAVNADGSSTHSDGIDNDRDGRTDEPGEMRSITQEILGLPLAERVGQRINLVGGERPDILGDELAWWIMNDVGNQKVFEFEQDGETQYVVARPIGLEVHGSAFAIDLPGDTKNATFYRLRIFNKGKHDLTQAHLGLFVDADLGDWTDNYFGSDTTHGLGIVYNMDNYDGNGGYGDAPPAFAYDILQGPVVVAPGETANRFDATLDGYRDLGMTSLIGYDNYFGSYGAPVLPAHYYNYMQALWRDGSPLTFGGHGQGISGEPTKFMYPGDPTKGEFWNRYSCDADNCKLTPAEINLVIGSGPFELGVGEEQDVFYAISWARGESNLDSYTQVVRAASRMQALFDSGVRVETEVEPVPPPVTTAVGWSAVYPNPSKGAVSYTFTLPVESDVRAEIFDSIGRLHTTLMHETRSAGPNEVDFDTSEWPAGVYALRMTFRGRAPVSQLFVVR